MSTRNLMEGKINWIFKHLVAIPSKHYSIVPELEILNVNRPNNTKCIIVNMQPQCNSHFFGSASLLHLRPKFNVTRMNYCIMVSSSGTNVFILVCSYLDVWRLLLNQLNRLKDCKQQCYITCAFRSLALLLQQVPLFYITLLYNINYQILQ